MIRFFKITGLVFCFLLLFNTPVFAAINISDVPEVILDEGGFSTTANITIGSSAGKNYFLRAAFSKEEDKAPYFGYTKNNQDIWYNGTPSPIDHTQFFKITMDENNSWNGSVFIKPDFDNTAYQGSGSYFLKVGRYTESGGTVTDWSNSVLIELAFAFSTPTPTPTPTATPTSNPTPTPTSTFTTAVKTPTPTLAATTTPIPTSVVQTTSDEEELVLGIQDNELVEHEDEGQELVAGVSDEKGEGINFFALGLIIGGVFFMGGAGYLFWKERKSGRIKPYEE